jgi:uncharacterized coiled-coil DUF342 family protein
VRLDGREDAVHEQIVRSTSSRGRQDADLPPAAIARRQTEGNERRRELARALHEKRQRAPKITERLAELSDQIAKYREKAIALHAKLVELEEAGEDVGALRTMLIESSVRLEQVVRDLIESEPG